MTFAELLTKLEPFDPKAPLIFEANWRAIGAGYHVTELRHSTTTGIDCGGNVETWGEARLQLMDGPGRTHMSVGKFVGIVKKSTDRLPELADAPIMVEFSPDNRGLKLMTIDGPESTDDRVILELRDTTALCKPAQKFAISAGTKSSCCGTPQAASACCAPEVAVQASGARCA